MASCQASSPRPSHLPFTLPSSVGPPGPAVCPWTRRCPMLPGAWASRHLPRPPHTCRQPAAIFRRLLQQRSPSVHVHARRPPPDAGRRRLPLGAVPCLLGTHRLQSRPATVAERPLPPRSAPRHPPAALRVPCLPLGAHTQLSERGAPLPRSGPCGEAASPATVAGGRGRSLPVDGPMSPREKPRPRVSTGPPSRSMAGLVSGVDAEHSLCWVSRSQSSHCERAGCHRSVGFRRDVRDPLLHPAGTHQTHWGP